MIESGNLSDKKKFHKTTSATEKSVTEVKVTLEALEDDKQSTDDYNEFLFSIWNFFELNLSKRTRSIYFNVVKGYIKYIGKTPLKLTQNDAYKYSGFLSERVNSHRLSYNTAQMRISVMRTVCDYIKQRKNSQGLEYINYFREIILPDEDKTIQSDNLPSIDDINGLFRIISENNDKTAYLLYSLILKCGLSASEAVSIKHDYLVMDSNRCFCITFPPKGKAHVVKAARVIKLPDDINTIFTEYIINTPGNYDYIFINKRGTNLKVRDAERMLKKYVDEGIRRGMICKPFTMQHLRHTALVYMFAGDASKEDVAAYTGITTKWMSRYRIITDDAAKLTTADKSIIYIKQ